MKKEIILSVFASLILATGCESTSTENQEATETEEVAAVSEEAENVEEVESVNVDSLVQMIDATRARIEALELPPVEVATTKLRKKLNQKWSTIHFYVENDQLVKVKTYPHAGVSARTEEFYLENGELTLVVIEDDGSGAKGKAKDQLDKMYYFNNSELVKELKSNTEAEFNQKQSDAEELQSEFAEYVELYKESLKGE